MVQENKHIFYELNCTDCGKKTVHIFKFFIVKDHHKKIKLRKCTKCKAINGVVVLGWLSKGQRQEWKLLCSEN